MPRTARAQVPIRRSFFIDLLFDQAGLKAGIRILLLDSSPSTSTLILPIDDNSQPEKKMQEFFSPP
jgi:hypothetical protein